MSTPARIAALRQWLARTAHGGLIRQVLLLALPAALAVLPAASAAEPKMPIFDAHVHYSHDAWEGTPPKTTIAILRKAGLKRAMMAGK